MTEVAVDRVAVQARTVRVLQGGVVFVGSVMWASTIGSVFGPIMSLAVAGPLLEAFGAPEHMGSYLLAGVLFVLAGGTIHRFLRPEPLQLAGGSANAFRPPSLGDLRFIASNFHSAIGASAMALSQAVMVGVMAVTSLHMLDGDQPRYMISLVISFHIVGMYAFSPWVGRFVDRFGSELMIAAGSVQLFIGAETASHTSAEDAPGVLAGGHHLGPGGGELRLP